MKRLVRSLFRRFVSLFLNFMEGNHFFAVSGDGDDNDNDGAYFLFFRLKSLENT